MKMVIESPSVEVLRTSKLGEEVWYIGEIVDVRVDKKANNKVSQYSVKIPSSNTAWSPGEEEDAGVDDPVEQFKPARVRLRSSWVAANFNPQVNDLCEVQIQGKGISGVGWWKCKIKSIKGGFYFVNFEPPQADAPDFIVEKFVLRPLPAKTDLLGDQFLYREVVKLDNDLQSWISNGGEDVEGCLWQVWHKANLLIARTYENQNSNGKYSILLI